MIKFDCWTEAYRCQSGLAELVIVTEIGPRILSLRWKEGPNLLYVDKTNFTVGEWRLYGGHRFTVAPEGRDSYAPDNLPCQVRSSSRELRVTSSALANGLKRTIIVRAGVDGCGFDLTHSLSNQGSMPWKGALWAITCVPAGSTLAPYNHSKIRYWPGTNDADWIFTPESITVGQSGRRCKIGWYSPQAWLASVQERTTLVLHDMNPPSSSECVDEGCNMELFSCPDYEELEMLSGEVTILQGGCASQQQRWRIVETAGKALDCALISRNALLLRH